MKISLLFLSLLSFSLVGMAQSTGADLIEASIKFHDPEGKWSSARFILDFNDTRPGKADRTASFTMDNTTGNACVTREIDDRMVSWHVENEVYRFDIDGNYEPTEQEIEKYRLTKDRGLTMRNYYLYLWGLPMKLKDPGTLIDEEIYERSFNGKPTKLARVTYDEAVGSDIWYFYFDPQTFEMVGYQFYHDEAKGDGEYITLEGLEDVNGMKLPKSRTWYINSDSTILGTDNLVHGHTLHQH